MTCDFADEHRLVRPGRRRRPASVDRIPGLLRRLVREHVPLVAVLLNHLDPVRGRTRLRYCHLGQQERSKLS